MIHPAVLEARKCVLVVVDVQESFRKSIADFSEIASRIVMVARGAEILQIPIIVTEQYPKGLGNTVNEIMSVLPGYVPIIEKTAFSACGNIEFLDSLIESELDQIILCGLETHICVNQTAHDLLANGFQVHVLADCVTSRSAENKQVGLSKMQQSGVILSNIEMFLFEIMRDSKHPNFREIQSLIK